MAERSLEEYRRKRDPDRSPEPFVAQPSAPTNRHGGIFVVQQHAARRMHWDLRLAIGGVLVSWAVPRGPSLDPKERRLAVLTEDHPLEYADFEGIIPAGNYGAGAMILWDAGTYRTVDGEPAATGLANGKLDLELRGHKLRGRWALVRTKSEKGRDWLLLSKGGPPPAGGELVVREPASVLSGLTIETLRDGVRLTDTVTERARSAGATPNVIDAARIAPMQAETGRPVFGEPGWVFELKYDGVRILGARARTGAARLYYRTRRDTTATFPEIQRAIEHLPCDDFILDGEIVALDERGVSSFELLQQRLGITDRAAVARARIETPVVMYCFDLLSIGGYDLRALPLLKRKELLAMLVPATGVLRYGEHFAGDGEAIFAEVSRLGFEGMVAKRAASPYRCGQRSADWRKIKALRTADVVVVGILRGQGSRAQLGSLMVAWYRDGQLTYAGNVGSGFDGTTLDSLWQQLAPLQQATPAFAGEPSGAKRAQVFVTPRLVAEVRYTEVTAAGVLRQPVFVRLRDDLQPDDCLAPAPSADRMAPPAVPPGIEGPDRPPPAGMEEHAAGHPPDAATIPLGAPREGESRLRLSNLGKVFWPEDGYTKADLIDYYGRIWPLMAPYLRDRPVVLTRYPDGIAGKNFFQKNAPEFTPEWVQTCHIEETDFFICNDRDTLLYVINSGCIPVHVWSARLTSLERPDWTILDLDPKGAPFIHVVALAQDIHRLLEQLAVPHFVKTSGQDGLHVLIPLGAVLTHAEARTFAEVLARLVAARHSDIATVARPLSERGGKVYLDFLQNGFGKTIVAPFSVRPRRGAPVSMPLAWREVNRRLDPARFTIRTAPKRFRAQSDPMAEVLTQVADVHAALEALLARMQAAASPPE